MWIQAVNLAILAACFGSAVSRHLVLKLEEPASSRDHFLRGHSLFSKGGMNQQIKVKCSLPASFNQSATPATAFWETGSGGDKKDSLSISPDSDASKEYKCVARNVDNKPIKDWEDTVLKYHRSSPDVNIIPPAVTVLNYSDSSVSELVFTCDVPKDTVSWFLDGQPITAADKNVHVYTNNTLVIKYPNHKDVGIYVCKVNTADNSSRLGFFSLEGRPFFAIKHGRSEDSENRMEGDSVSIKHELYGNPLDEVKWFKKKDEDSAEEPIDLAFTGENPRYKFYPTMNTSNGELEINDMVKDDRAYYISRASNDHGNTEFKTLVRVKGRLDALWPFLGIVAEVIILVAIILIYERRRLKQESEADEALDQKKPLTSTNNDSVRQRKN